MAYNKTTWTDSGTPDINAQNLNHIEQGIYDATNTADSAAPQSTTYTKAEVDAAVATKSSKASVLTGTLTVADWSNNTQTLTISGLATSGYAYTLAPASASFTNFAEAQIYADDVTTANQMTFHCETTPTSAINVVILKCEVA